MKRNASGTDNTYYEDRAGKKRDEEEEREEIVQIFRDRAGKQKKENIYCAQ